MLVYHVTVLSNFAKAYDKYARVYDKSAIPESTYPNMMFVLKEEEIFIGVNKVAGLINRLNNPLDRILIMAGEIDESLIHPNDVTGTGLGQFINGSRFPVSGVRIDFQDVSIEEAYARSLLLQGNFKSYNDLAPRSLSWLPVGQACQAKCKFCFSEASASFGQDGKSNSTEHLPAIMAEAANRGAKRFVITGGGEPTLMKHKEIVSAISLANSHFDKSILITNGIKLAKHPEYLVDYNRAGLSTLAISRHHYNDAVNQFIMGVDNRTEEVTDAACSTSMDIRLICVLQKSGVNSVDEVIKYLEWAANIWADEVCFKELYVSTTLESVYAGQEENRYSEANQVPLSIVMAAMERLGAVKTGELPWGSPTYEVRIKHWTLKVAAYTEPSMFWERQNGLARSWNIMQDGTILASLEDPNSQINIGDDG